MTGTGRRRALALFGCAVIAGCTIPAPGSQAVDDYFGEKFGGTGIVGMLTGFGSLQVNGLTLEVNRSTRFRTAYGPTNLSALQPGMLLTVFANRTARGIRASEVWVDYALVGQLRQEHIGMSVNGVSIQTEPGASVRAALGDRVAVSGVWRGAGVVATRIDRTAGVSDLVSGIVTSGGRTPSVGGVEIVAPGTTLVEGSFAQVLGEAIDGGIVVQGLRTSRFGAGFSMRQLSAEGFLEVDDGRPGFRIAGLGHHFSPDLNLAKLTGHRGIFVGPFDGSFAARTAFVVPEDARARFRLLARGVSGAKAVSITRV